MRFSGVGALGIGVQIAVIAWLANVWRVDYRAATLAGVAAAIVHNFLWHRHWTWGERREAGGHDMGGHKGRPYDGYGLQTTGYDDADDMRVRRATTRVAPTGSGATFARFVAANGLVSIGGNVAVMTVLVGGAHVPIVPANAVAIALCSLANFWLADRVVFIRRDRESR
jgi:putative flippase GtrA